MKTSRYIQNYKTLLAPINVKVCKVCVSVWVKQKVTDDKNVMKLSNDTKICEARKKSIHMMEGQR